MTVAIKRRQFGRILIAQSLAGAAYNLEQARTDLDKAQADVERAIKACKDFTLGKKRITQALDKEIKNLKDLQKTVAETPLTKSERLVKRREVDSHAAR